MLSGVNRGRNVAEDVTYSGTVAGAMEGTVLGIPSFALSQAYRRRHRHLPHWETAIKFAPDLIRRVLAAGMPRDVLVNVNFPDCPPDEVAGVAVAAQGKRDQELLRIDARHDGRGNPYYWIAFGRGGIAGAAHGSDLAALNDKRIAVTPLRLDLTDEPFMTKLAEVFSLERLARNYPSSCPALCRASTSFFARQESKDVDGRDEPGHDESVRQFEKCLTPPASNPASTALSCSAWNGFCSAGRSR